MRTPPSASSGAGLGGGSPLLLFPFHLKASVTTPHHYLLDDKINSILPLVMSCGVSKGKIEVILSSNTQSREYTCNS
jgi:hypothetical protein